MIVYIDQLFAINFAADFIVLYIACGFSCRRRVGFIILGAFLGGIYGACMYIPPVKILYNPLFKMIFAGIMVFIASAPKNFTAFLRSELTFAVISAMLGGGVFAVLFLLGYSVSEIAHNSIPVFNAPAVLLLAAFCMAVFGCRVGYTLLVRNAETKKKIAKLTVFACGRKVTVNGLIDTGCNLRNPSGQEPVIIVNHKNFKDIIRKTARVCIIPYSTVSGGGSFLGFRPDYVEIDGKAFDNVVVAVCYTNNLKNKMYSAIINSDILKEESDIA